MKKHQCFTSLLLIAMIILLTLCFAGCWDEFFPNGNGNSDATQQIKTINLTMENYEYYLSIDRTLTGSGSAAGGSFRYYSYKATISGAVSGLYKNCAIYYMLGDTEHEVKLNAAGFATFNYTVSTNSGSFKFSRVTGEIII